MEPAEKTLKFRPQEFDGKFKIKRNPVGRWYWQERHYSNKHVWRVGGHLHYLAQHAPASVCKKWHRAFFKFCKLHPKF